MVVKESTLQQISDIFSLREIDNARVRIKGPLCDNHSTLTSDN